MIRDVSKSRVRRSVSYRDHRIGQIAGYSQSKGGTIGDGKFDEHRHTAWAAYWDETDLELKRQRLVEFIEINTANIKQGGAEC